MTMTMTSHQDYPETWLKLSTTLDFSSATRTERSAINAADKSD